MGILLRLALGFVTSLVVFYVAKGIYFESAYALVMISVILGVVNAGVPYAVTMVSVSKSMTTIGLFTLGLNTFILFLMQSLNFGVMTSSLQSTLTVAVMISAITWMLTLALDSSVRTDQSKKLPDISKKPPPET